MSKKDWCSFFLEYWFKRTGWKFKIVYIGGCCMLHDNTCSARKFYRCLRKLIGKGSARLIVIGGTLGCNFKYPKTAYKADFKD